MNHSIIFNDIALLLLLVLVMRRTRKKAEPSIHIHPCVSFSSELDFEKHKEAITASIDQIGRDALK